MNVSLAIAFKAVDTKNEKQIDMMTISRENFLEACIKFPRSADLVQEYCIEQIDRLSEQRSLGEHLNPGNFSKVQFCRESYHLEDRATMANMPIQVIRMTKT